MLFVLQKHPKRIVLLAIILNAFLHLPFLNLPPCSIHVWRQCNTLAVARNFYEEGGNIFHPHVDKRNDGDGITGMQFPAYEWMVSRIYFITGVHNWVHRSFSLLISSLGIWLLFSFFNQITKNTLLSACTAWSFCWSPELFYHGINALPDILALTSGIASLYFFSVWMEKRKSLLFFIAMFCMLISGLVKMQYLMFGGFIFGMLLVEFLRDKNSFSKREIVMLISSGAIVVSLVFCWYGYASKLIEQSNLRDFVISVRPENDFHIALTTLKKNLISDLPELMLNYANTVLLILGAIVFFTQKKWRSKLFIPFLFVAIIYFIYHLLELHQMVVHQYYMLPVLIPFIAIIAIGIQQLIEKKAFVILLIILIAQPVLAGIRILPARWIRYDKGIPAVFLDKEKLTQLQNAVPDNERVLVGPDESGCIYFYFLHKKGVGFENTDDLYKKSSSGKTMIEDAIHRGVKYIYCKNDDLEKILQLKPFINKKIIQEGDFSLYRLNGEK